MTKGNPESGHRDEAMVYYYMNGRTNGMSAKEIQQALSGAIETGRGKVKLVESKGIVGPDEEELDDVGAMYMAY